MDWGRKYKELTSGFYQCCNDISDKYPECSDFEKCVISLRLNGWTYGNIQKKLGMPPKKEISLILKKWAPELIDNSKEKIIKISSWESEIYNIVNSKGSLTIEFEGDPVTFTINNHKLFYEDWSGINEFHELNNIMQQQYLIAIKDQVNE